MMVQHSESAISKADLQDRWHSFRLKVWRKLQERLREVKEDGINQKVIADRLGMDETQLSKILSGRHNVTLKTMHNVARAIGCRPEIEFVKLDELVRSNHPVAGIVWASKQNVRSGNNTINNVKKDSVGTLEKELRA